MSQETLTTPKKSDVEDYSDLDRYNRARENLESNLPGFLDEHPEVSQKAVRETDGVGKKLIRNLVTNWLAFPEMHSSLLKIFQQSFFESHRQLIGAISLRNESHPNSTFYDVYNHAVYWTPENVLKTTQFLSQTLHGKTAKPPVAQREKSTQKNQLSETKKAVLLIAYQRFNLYDFSKICSYALKPEATEDQVVEFVFHFYKKQFIQQAESSSYAASQEKLTTYNRLPSRDKQHEVLSRIPEKVGLQTGFTTAMTPSRFGATTVSPALHRHTYMLWRQSLRAITIQTVSSSLDSNIAKELQKNFKNFLTNEQCSWDNLIHLLESLPSVGVAVRRRFFPDGKIYQGEIDTEVIDEIADLLHDLISTDPEKHTNNAHFSFPRSVALACCGVLALTSFSQLDHDERPIQYQVIPFGSDPSAYVEENPATEEVIRVAEVPSASEIISNDTYIVQAGDTLFAIGQRFGVSVDTIAQANNISNPDMIPLGLELKIPPASSVPVSLENIEHVRPYLPDLSEYKRLSHMENWIVVTRSNVYGLGEPLNTYTSSGEVFDPNALTIASWALNFGEEVWLINPANGKHVRVVSNDHGPNRNPDRFKNLAGWEKKDIFEFIIDSTPAVRDALEFQSGDALVMMKIADQFNLDAVTVIDLLDSEGEQTLDGKTRTMNMSQLTESLNMYGNGGLVSSIIEDLIKSTPVVMAAQN